MQVARRLEEAVMGLTDDRAGGHGGSLPTRAAAAELLHGAMGIREHDDRWVRPLRVSEAQLRALGSCQAWHPGLFRQMALTCAGVRVEFETDAREVVLELRVDREPRGTRAVLEGIDRNRPEGDDPHDMVSVDIDGHHEACGMPAEGDEVLSVSLVGHDREDDLGLQALPGLARTRHVRIWLPALRGCMVRDVWCDGTAIRPVAPKRNLLVLGDSVAQGFVSDDPARSWPALLAARLGLDLVNQGIGGQVFQPGSLAGLAGSVDPERIVVAYGENYRYEACAAAGVSRDVRLYLRELSHLWPQATTYVLTPLWHDEAVWPSHARSCHAQVPSLIAEQVAPYDQMTLVDGLGLLDHDPALLADGHGYPNERGCRQIALRLNAVIRVPGLRPSSVGKRRKRKRARTERARTPRQGGGGAPRLPLDGLP